MKKLLVIAFMVVGTTTFAQAKDGSENNIMTLNNTKLIEGQSQKMKNTLGLSDDQTAQIKAWITKQDKDREAIMAEARALKAEGQQFTEAQKNEIKSKMDAQKTATDTQLKSILTPKQYTKWQEHKETRKKEIEARAIKPNPAG